MSRREEYTAQQMADAIKSSRGLKSHAAQRLGCNRATVDRYIREYATVKQAHEEARQATTDLAEASLYRAIQNGEGWATCFYLKTQGKDRGYVERQEVTGRDGGAIETRELSKTEREATELDAEIARLEQQFDAGAVEEGESQS